MDAEDPLVVARADEFGEHLVRHVGRRPVGRHTGRFILLGVVRVRAVATHADGELAPTSRAPASRSARGSISSSRFAIWFSRPSSPLKKRSRYGSRCSSPEAIWSSSSSIRAVKPVSTRRSKLRSQELVRREAGERRDELAPVARHVAPVHDRVDDRGVRGRAADARGFERLDERGVGEAGGRLGLVARAAPPRGSPACRPRRDWAAGCRGRRARRPGCPSLPRRRGRSRGRR